MKLKKVAPGGGGCSRGQPGDQWPGIPAEHRVQQQRRQAELVDHVRLVALAEIADVLGMRDVGLGQQQHVRGERLNEVAQQLDHLVRLRQVDAGGPRLLPEIGDRVQPDDACACSM